MIIEIKHGTFTPLAMSVKSSFDKACTNFYSKLAELILVERKESYSTTLS